MEFADFNLTDTESPMTETTMPLIELLRKRDKGDFLRAVSEAVLRQGWLDGLRLHRYFRIGKRVIHHQGHDGVGLVRFVRQRLVGQDVFGRNDEIRLGRQLRFDGLRPRHVGDVE